MGTLIAIEGTDGSGKKTQTAALAEYLNTHGIRTATLAFPRYGNRSAKLIERYLNGEFGDASTLDPYVTSLFYAIDRREGREEINSLVAQNDIVILDRYVDSNAGHQGSKIVDELERGVYLDWLYQTEYEVFAIPRPQLVVVLYVPAELSFNLVAKKEKRSYIQTDNTHDAHEENLAHLKETERTYHWLAREHTDTHRVISCVDENDNLFSPQLITERILRELSEAGIVQI